MDFQHFKLILKMCFYTYLYLTSTMISEHTMHTQLPKTKTLLPHNKRILSTDVCKPQHHFRWPSADPRPGPWRGRGSISPYLLSSKLLSTGFRRGETGFWEAARTKYSATDKEGRRRDFPIFPVPSVASYPQGCGRCGVGSRRRVQ